MLQRLRRYHPFPTPRPTLWLSTRDPSAVTRAAFSDVRSSFCTPAQQRGLWRWFLYVCDRRDDAPTEVVHEAAPHSLDWQTDSYLYNLAADVRDLDARGYYTIALVALRDGVVAFSSTRCLNWYLNLDRVGRIRCSH